MSVFDKIKLPSAVNKFNTFNLSCDHVTTQNFFAPKIVCAREIAPRSSIRASVENLVRLSPLLAPSFLRARVVVRAFFVPFQYVWNRWNYFITNVVAPDGTTRSGVPTLANNLFVRYFTLAERGCMTEVTSGNVYDVKVAESISGSTITYKTYNFTKKGRHLYDLLIGLGYKIFWSKLSTTAYPQPDAFSALPIMCMCKVITDWYYYNQYEQSNFSDRVRETLGYGNTLTEDNFVSYMDYLANFKGNYDNDYFTSAFINPNGPAVSTGSFTLKNNGSGSDVTVGTEAVISSQINQFAIDALKSLSDYIKRNQLAGSQAIDRFMSHWGIRFDHEEVRRSMYLGSSSTNIQIGEVFNTGDSTIPLGDYAGKGLGYGSTSQFQFDSKADFGMFIVVSDIVPNVGYVQGVKRHTLHKDFLDFFTPELDSLGNQAIALKELSLPYDNSLTDNFLSFASGKKPDDRFGFTPRYAEYKFPLDYLSGNFIYNSTNLGEDAWHGFRLLSDSISADRNTGRYSGTPTAGTAVLKTSDSDQYDRIFADDSTTDTAGNDHFRCIYHCDIVCKAPMSELFDNYEFREKGNDVIMRLGGETLKN